ncbi:hypothetical protein [Flavobacterium sp. AJR]|uniref:hypothetical protein n=1 Tax=Flavobacterium sp. AJR TaxID=1979369 RepID=UPI000F4EAEC7|nr:hypothetical protein [Flavobacterium sp. AJR]
MRRIIYIFLLVLSCALSFGQKKEYTEKPANKIIALDSLKASTASLMTKYNLKGLSVAVFENYKIIWTNEWGTKASDSEEKSQSKYRIFNSINL